MMGSKDRRAFASILVVAILPIVATALLAIAVVAAGDARGTTAAGQDAQLRQLLLAGGTVMLERSSTWGDAPVAESFEVPVPRSLLQHDASVRVTIEVEGHAVAVGNIEASYAGRQSHQVVRMARSERGWRVEEVALDPLQ